MTAVIKAIFILLFQIIIYYLFGTVFERFCRRNHGLVFKEIIGFLFYQAVFQICALTMIELEQTLTRLTVLWFIITAAVCFCAFFFCGKEIRADLYNAFLLIKRHKGSAAFLFFVLAAMCYYVSINGELNDDSLYYIGLVNTTLSSDQFYKFNVYTGLQTDSHYLRRALVTFDINAAAACRFYQIHPLVFERITRSCLHILLLGGSVYLIAGILFREKKEVFSKAAVFTGLALFCNFAFDNTIFTSAFFLLHRTYEGKAYAGNFLTITAVYLCALCIMQREKKNYIYLLLILWACAAISSSAILVVGAACAVLLLPAWGMRLKCKIKRDKKYE